MSLNTGTYRWISVNDDIPEGINMGKDVLAVNAKHEYLVGLVYAHHANHYVCESDDQFLYDITHWMPLPEPPKEIA